MIRAEKYLISKENIAMHELIGLKARVYNSTDAKKIGINGKIVNETKNTLIIETRLGEKVLPKKEVFLEIKLGKEKVQLNCSRIAFRPEDRTKKIWKTRGGVYASN